MQKIKAGLTGFILGDWLGMPYRGKGKGTFRPVRTKSYLRGGKCSGNTSLLLCALDSRCDLVLYRQNLKEWCFHKKYTGEHIEFDVDSVIRKSVMTNFRAVSSDAHSGNRSLMGCCVLAFTSLSREEILPFVKATHNCRYNAKYTCFFIELIRELLRGEQKEHALRRVERKCDVCVNRQNFSNGNFVVDTVESVVNCFMAGNNYAECVFLAINSGKSSDAVGALTGLLAGLYYGVGLTNGVKDFGMMEAYIDSFLLYLRSTL
ncbi:ADP-ribosylglycohydrolase family protein [Phocaeicola sp.]|uniref:ADP-ribosylglycohydrolase family protein n=1 Tax=Phocaeicola sp. TaxID=2773926 RepID=UPI0023C0F118|nr:ADP-ribosylglycohydrolase family protein [Phocaeicola sp.]MDE5678666.1 ADP-ribosylglycohydrolase family protein [Phocaeicola sp.]